MEVKALIMYQTSDTEREIGWHVVWYNANPASIFSPKNSEAETTKASVLKYLFQEWDKSNILAKFDQLYWGVSTFYCS